MSRTARRGRGGGRYTRGPYRGLQACATLITEGDWGHWRKDAPGGPPKWTAPEMARPLRDFAARGNVPIFNLEITQEGAVSPASIEAFREARRPRDAGQ